MSAAADFTDARLVEYLRAAVFLGRFRWAAGFDWLRWDGRRWAACSDVEVIEAVRRWACSTFDDAVQRQRTGEADAEEVKRHFQLLSRGKVVALVQLARGLDGVLTDAGELDADPWALNTPGGIVDLRTGAVSPHNPDRLLTKLASGSYVRGRAPHPDWTAALEALAPPEREWLRVRLGQAVTGQPAPDGLMILLQGSGENGKSLISTDGPVVALGDYASMASAKLITAGRGTEHSTEMAALQGQRLLVAEEMTEGRTLDVGTLKRINDVGTITARRVYRDNITFRASHSLFVTSNYLPVVAETDHGTWRRLALLAFPYTFRKEGEPLERPEHRRGDPDLKSRLRDGDDGQHDAVITWLVEGAIRAHKEGAAALAPTPAVQQSTREWRRVSDRIVGLWDEVIVADLTCCVIADDLVGALNAWLQSHGHAAWPRETFTGRFADHTETRRHGVTQRQLAATQDPHGREVVTGRDLGPAGALWLVRPTEPHKPTPKRPRVWTGVRWRTDADAPADEARR